MDVAILGTDLRAPTVRTSGHGNATRGLIAALLLLFTNAKAAAPPAITPGGNPSVVTVAGPDTPVLIDIKPQALADALTAWAQQTGLQIIVPAVPAADNLLTHPVQGFLVPRAALSLILAGSPLEYEFITARTVVIKSTDPAAALLAKEDTRPPSAVKRRKRGQDDRTTPDGVLQSNLLLDEIVVAGTHIRGGLLAGSRVQWLDRYDISALGYTTVQDVLETLPAHLGGGPSEDFDDGASGNFNRGTSVNLRGLGADATLVLVNGRRQAPSGTAGAFVDISSIPAAAVDRIEVVTDGGSALYGSDAVGGVVNIVLRDNYEGAETRARYGEALDARERQISQIVGTNWLEGNALIGYQFYDRQALSQSARFYSANEDKRPFGGDDFRLFMSNPGNILDPRTGIPAFAIPAGQDGTSLQTGDLLPHEVNLQGVNEAADLLPHQQVHGVFFNARHRFSDDLSFRADGRYSRREMEQQLFALPVTIPVPVSNPFFVNPFPGPVVLVAYSLSDDLGAVQTKGRTDTLTAGADATLDLSGSWQGRLSASYAREKLGWRAHNQINFAALMAAVADPDPATAFNPFGDGSHTNPDTLNAIRRSEELRAVSQLANVNLMADGTMFQSIGGAAKLAAGLDYREEALERPLSNLKRVGRSIVAGFAELEVPILEEANAVPIARELAVSLAFRHEHYSDFGATTNPRVGLTWAPIEALKVRGTWGTSFRAPSIADADETPPSTGVGVVTLLDPKATSGRSFVLLRTGNNADLTEETATVWNAGLDLLWPGEKVPTLSLTYFSIDFRNRIAVGGPPGQISNILLQEEDWRELIQRSPSPSAVDALCSSAQFIGNPESCALPIAAIVDLRRRNLGAVRVQGIDVSFARTLQTGWGSFRAGLEGTYLLQYERAASHQSEALDVVDTIGNPLALRLRGSLSWQRRQWSANAFVSYAGDYVDKISRPARSIGSWTRLDLHLAYHVPDDAGLFSDVEWSLNATNALDRSPPFANSRIGYDPTNADPLGRIISVRFTKWW
jgi:iron complex outermembrane recepter protein